MKFFNLTIYLLFFPVIVFAQETIAPPTLGQKTKGEPAPAVSESTAVSQTLPSSTKIEDTSNIEETSAEDKSELLNIFGTTKVSELRRENGRLYRIELEHSSGSKQVIEELDSDGKIESTSNDIEETPNLPKWRLGSW